MIRFVVRNEDGTLGMTATSGFEPPNFLCRANDEWIVDELSWDGSSGLVYVDPAKVSKKQKELDYANKLNDTSFNIVRAKHWLDQNWIPLTVIVVIILALAFGAFKYWQHVKFVSL